MPPYIDVPGCMSTITGPYSLQVAIALDSGPTAAVPTQPRWSARHSSPNKTYGARISSRDPQFRTILSSQTVNKMGVFPFLYAFFGLGDQKTYESKYYSTSDGVIENLG